MRDAPGASGQSAANIAAAAAAKKESSENLNETNYDEFAG